MNSPYYEKPTIVKNVMDNVLTNADLSIYPNADQRLWGKLKD